MQQRSGSSLKIRPLFSENRSLDRAHLQTDPTIDAGVEIDPVELSSFLVATLAGLDAGDGTGIEAIGDAFADIGHDRMGHERIESGSDLSQ